MRARKAIRLLSTLAIIPLSVAAAQVSSTGSPAIDPVGPVLAQPQSPVNGRDDRSQAASTNQGIATFHAEARLVLITAGVWKRKADKDPDQLLVPAGVLRDVPPWALTSRLRYAERLDTRIGQSDFHAFDNGIEQRISYFRRTVVPLKDITKESETSWNFYPEVHGTWGYPPGYFHSYTITMIGAPPGATPELLGFSSKRSDFSVPNITYVIGYVPPTLEPGECHDVRVEVADHDVGLNRNQYCAGASSHDVDDATQEGTEVGARMRSFADSEVSGSIKVSARAFTFWSSRVLYLTTQDEAGRGTAPPGSDLNFVVEARGSNAPARVHVATEFVFPRGDWTVDCRQKPSLHVLVMAYKENHQIAGQFGDSLTCPSSELARKQREIFEAGGQKVQFPNRLDAQMYLGPGDYDLRVVVSNGERELGRARLPLHVGSLDGQQLEVSEIVLSSFPREASKALDDAVAVSPAPIVPAPLISKNIQFLPDTETRIARHMRLPLYFEIYEPLLKQSKTEVYMHLRVTNLKNGSVVRDSGLMRTTDWVLPENTVIPVGFSLGTQNLSKGNYRVDVQATDAAGRASAWRQANFTIE